MANYAAYRRNAERWPYIVAYSRYMSSYHYWTEEQLEYAAQIDAPEDTYRIDRPGDRVGSNTVVETPTPHTLANAPEALRERLEVVKAAIEREARR